MTSTEPTMNTNPLHLESGAAHPVAKPHRVGLKDIADELGISQTAVSFAINDRPGVSEETKRRVKEAASKLGWSPVYAAQALGSSKTMTVGFAPARSSNGLRDEGFMLHFMTGLHESLSLKGYGLLYRPCSSVREELSVYEDWARRKRVDGVILVDLRADDPRPALLARLGVPAVLAGGPDPEKTSCPRCRLTIQAPWKRFSDIWYHADTGVSHTYRGTAPLTIRVIANECSVNSQSAAILSRSVSNTPTSA